ncbi:RA-domain-containing protein [Periconia macrospinosa]|uniref:RA-domain-containing protein n=1 Tax=Periconia macrospinosa TaxID=97972 RepID=A0A2V1DVY1_9PLEO|nr:RA-domain-containing protein [Periconia macrospinosa]
MTTLAATSYSTSKYHGEDSDADDEYERSVIQSPTLPVDYAESSSTSSGPMSTEHTPTTFTHSRDAKGSPTTLITEWTEEQSADFVSDLGLDQYADSFVEQGISGDALIALQHGDLKDMGLNSVGHRLTILKAVYEIKVKQNVPIEPDHYIPLSADTSAQDAPPTQDDLAKVIRVVQARDERIRDNETKIRHLEDDLIKVVEENKRLREEILPLVRAFKDSQQPLPTPHDHIVMSPPAQPVGSTLSRKFSTKRLFLSSGPKNPSPTIPEGRALVDNSSLDPSAAALAASSHLTASIAGGSLSPNPAPQPSPTSPAYGQRNVYTTTRSDNTRSGHPDHEPQNSDPRGVSGPARGSVRNPTSTTPNPDGDPPLSGGTMTSNPAQTPGSSNPQVEIFKSFRVSIDDPCHKVLPVALKKYNITADWRQYALYIVHGDQERCLGLNERPLILFKQLDKEGRKPMFMLRKHAAPAEGHVSTVGGNDIRSVGPGNSFGWDSSNRVQLPGGVL